MEDALSDLLAGLGLSRYAPIFEEEAITEVALLKSIGSTTFVSSMAELSMDEYAAEALRAELFGAEAPRSAPSARPGLLTEESDDELALEENEEGGGDDDHDNLALEENEPPPRPPDMTTTAAATAAAASAAAIADPPPTRTAPSGGATGVAAAVGAAAQARRHKEEGNAALQAGKHAEAARLYGKAIECDPTDPVYHSNRSAAFAAIHRFAAALADADEAARLRPGWAKAHVRRGAALMALGRLEEAQRAYGRAAALEPGNAQLRQLASEAEEAATAVRGGEGGEGEGSNWVSVLKEEVRFRTYIELADDDDEAEALAAYARDLSSALDELREGGACLALRTGARGAAVDVTGVSAATAAGLTVEGTLRKSGRPVCVRLRHLTSYYDAEEHEGTAEQDVLVRSEMASAAAEERLRLQRLSGAAGWCQLVKELGSEVEAAVGVGCELTRYPAVYVVKIEGVPLSQLLDAGGGCGGEEDETPSPERLEHEMSMIKAVATSCLLAMRGAAAVGLGFDGTAPFAEHVWVQGPPEGARRAADWSVVVGEVEPLEERDPSERFSAKDLVRSALGEWLREWWRSTAPKLGIVDGRTPHEGYARVLGRYGVLNWLLFGWADEQLDGESILQLVQHGPVSDRSAEEREAAQRRWAAFTQEAFVRLGPRRFDEMNAQIGQMNDGDISVDDLLARARYFMCPDNEDLHAALGQMIRG